MYRRTAFLFSLVFLAALTTHAMCGDPSTAKPIRLDHYGDPLPDGAVFRVGTTRLRYAPNNPPPDQDVLLSPKGKFVFSCSNADGAVRMCEIASGREIHRFPTESFYQLIALSANGSRLATCDGLNIHLYDTATAKKLRTIDLSLLSASTRLHYFLRFSSGGKILTLFHSRWQEDSNLVSRWDAATGKLLDNWPTGKDRPLALSPDGRLMASLGEEDGIIRLWQTATRKKIREWKARDSISLSDRCLIFSPDGRRIVTAGEDGMIRVYETAGGKELRHWKNRLQKDVSGTPDGDECGWLAFAPNGKILASVDRNHVLQLWDAEAGRELRHIEGIIGRVAFSADGRVLAAGGGYLHSGSWEGSRIRLWDVTTGRDLCPFVDPGATVTAAFSPNGRVLAVASSRGYSRLLDAETGRELKRIAGYCFLAFSPDGRRLLAHRQDDKRRKPLCLLDAATGEERVCFRDTNDGDRLGGWSADGKILAIVNREDSWPLRVWNATTGAKLRELRGETQFFNAVCSSDARIAAVADNGDKLIHLFAVDSGKELRRLTGYSDRVHYEATTKSGTFSFLSAEASLPPLFSSDGKTVLAGCDRDSFGLWDVAGGKRTLQWSCAELLPVRPIFSPDGQWLALPDTHGDPWLVNARTGRLRHRLAWKGREGREADFSLDSVYQAFSADGRLLAVAYDKSTLVLWETATGRPVHVLSGHGKGELSQMIFSSDSRHLATVSTDGTALIWDAVGLSADGRLPARSLTQTAAEQAWIDLAGQDATKAHRAIWTLSTDPKRALPLLRERLHPLAALDPQRLAPLIADLDNEDFAVREAAARELKKLGELARPALRKAMKTRSSLEVRRRVKGLLEALESVPLTGENLRACRAVAVLEHIDNSEGRQLLQRLASGAAEARLTREAKSSLIRLARRAKNP